MSVCTFCLVAVYRNLLTSFDFLDAFGQYFLVVSLILQEAPGVFKHPGKTLRKLSHVLTQVVLPGVSHLFLHFKNI